jgi:aminoglycoside phosphotransferase (APT) family kinase protein
MKMHEREVDIDGPLVQRLLATQLPELANLPIAAVRSTGTVNAIFRLGEHLCARLPRVSEWATDLEREQRWLPVLAPYLPLRVPRPVERGVPGTGYPFAWSVYEWIDGEPYADALVDDERQAAHDLALFVQALRRVPQVAAAPAAGRRPLRELDAATRASIEAARGVIDVDAAHAAWELAIAGPALSGPPVWIHTDLLRPNLLVRDGRLAAVIDFGGVGVGDPAADVIAAWSVLGDVGRTVFRATLDIDDVTWNRARGFALHQAAVIIPYYAESNPEFVAMARRTVEQVLADIAD